MYIIWIVSIAMLWGCTNPLLKKGSKGIEVIRGRTWWRTFLGQQYYLYTKPTYVCYFLLNQSGSVLYFWSLSTAEIRYVVPMTNALTLLCTFVSSSWIEGTPWSMKNCIGICCILLGVSITLM